ncbi:unnamed protein product [Cyprideis torosa]|uniref:Uncharacterized protein n=1 Tax=Cyprideis torosa TaxID=163714 RepID=A0A7R8WIC2_9CRUS|nr:unnamed protein product [Cyprideis torosa]CAG0894300.1 unnamed protein product [Cyprideis torosa]
MPSREAKSAAGAKPGTEVLSPFSQLLSRHQSEAPQVRSSNLPEEDLSSESQEDHDPGFDSPSPECRLDQSPSFIPVDLPVSTKSEVSSRKTEGHKVADSKSKPNRQTVARGRSEAEAEDGKSHTGIEEDKPVLTDEDSMQLSFLDKGPPKSYAKSVPAGKSRYFMPNREAKSVAGAKPGTEVLSPFSQLLSRHQSEAPQVRSSNLPEEDLSSESREDHDPSPECRLEQSPSFIPVELPVSRKSKVSNRRTEGYKRTDCKSGKRRETVARGMAVAGAKVHVDEDSDQENRSPTSSFADGTPLTRTVPRGSVSDLREGDNRSRREPGPSASANGQITPKFVPRPLLEPKPREVINGRQTARPIQSTPAGKDPLRRLKRGSAAPALFALGEIPNASAPPRRRSYFPRVEAARAEEIQRKR